MVKNDICSRREISHLRDGLVGSDRAEVPVEVAERHKYAMGFGNPITRYCDTPEFKEFSGESPNRMIFGGRRRALGNLVYLAMGNDVNGNIQDFPFVELTEHARGMDMGDNVP